jgi:hypothetical protein
MDTDWNVLLVALAVLGLLAVALPLAWPQSGHELEAFDDDLRRQN